MHMIIYFLAKSSYFSVSWRLKASVTQLFAQQFIQAHIEGNMEDWFTSISFMRGIHRLSLDSPNKRPVNAESVAMYWRHRVLASQPTEYTSCVTHKCGCRATGAGHEWMHIDGV